jgi:hypothetical protein
MQLLLVLVVRKMLQVVTQYFRLLLQMAVVMALEVVLL